MQIRILALLAVIMAVSIAAPLAMTETTDKADPNQADNDVDIYFDVGSHSSTFNGLELDPNSDENPGLFQEPVLFVGFSFQQNFNISNKDFVKGNDVFVRADLRFGGVNIEDTEKVASSGDGVKVGEQILRNTETLEFGLDIFFNWRDSESAPVAFFSSGRVRGYSPTEEEDPNNPTSDFLSDRAFYPIGIANNKATGPFNGSYLQIGFGRSDRFVERTRYLADAYILVGPNSAEKNWKFFIEFNVNIDGTDGPDEVRATFGIHYNLAERIRKWMKGQEPEPQAGTGAGL